MVTAIGQWVRSPEAVRRLAYAATALTVTAVVGTIDENVLVPAGWVWLVLPAALTAMALPPGQRTVVFAACAGFVALVSTGESVHLGLAAAGLVFVSTCEDPARRPWRGWAAGVAGAAVAFTIALLNRRGVYAQPFAFVAAGYLLAVLLRSWSRGNALTRETTALRDQAAWLEQRTNLARELHDVVGHHVTAMVVQAEAGQFASDPAVALRAIATSGRTALRELDTLVVHLRDPDAPILVSAPPRLSDIDELLAEPLRQQGLAVHVRVDADAGLDEVGALAAYRIAQEAITNIARHANATTAWVELTRAGGQARLRVSDNGIGPPQAVARGSGLLGIEERARALGGSSHVSGRPGGGTVLEAILPVAKP
ncbi:sensor histidine kinase [Micromonospora sp. ALFpr18c]|uniref:sensor histidine kinase n=1 Tax=unclassified Micromonospora TaxID=2617518 RepID=UPI00124B739C|nr:sensor histidine kinase [Micromonospora sp. ALFpr18c]KAB1930656.1 sensor histidine kinase [Micromonospora sp. ALFpr18c]